MEGFPLRFLPLFLMLIDIQYYTLCGQLSTLRVRLSRKEIAVITHTENSTLIAEVVELHHGHYDRCKDKETQYELYRCNLTGLYYRFVNSTGTVTSGMAPYSDRPLCREYLTRRQVCVALNNDDVIASYLQIPKAYDPQLISSDPT